MNDVTGSSKDMSIAEQVRCSVGYLARHAKGLSMTQWDLHSNFLLDASVEIERLQRENEALRNLAENLRPGPISEALAGSMAADYARAGIEPETAPAGNEVSDVRDLEIEVRELRAELVAARVILEQIEAHCVNGRGLAGIDHADDGRRLRAGLQAFLATPSSAALPPLPAPWHSYKNDPPSVDDALAGVAYAWEFHKGTWVIEVAIANRPMYDHEPELWARAADVLPCSTATKCEGRS
jgi:hypothetical protein